ncbi:hypothetical protein DICPUDRAFT_92689 [Dictyostelium purpureum]|uniref:non-specific serine/threonine protein kinase n=1 Tax=Dictyostelium purpureum TaxID=5786 RepID=F0ZVR3_DICPU|nr:uncharacterized protein DICPUDRAFT_92689 [Dictyostelium purpureum]EGC31966.1 hypothetical protein DICPUDRAFT_92689 [Dictyostelium purpureum]|eukprot:XP_003291502.1 hypothetical protein DICPUDRAFT_92689 [Dictyostelium purpureum]
MEKRKTKSVDIFSLGCIFYYFITNGQHPFGDRIFRVVNIVSDKPNFEHLVAVQPILCDLIKQMVSKDEKSRPTIDQITQHPFFWNYDKKIKFIDNLNNLFKDQNLFDSNLNRLLNFIDIEDSGCSSNTLYLGKPWNKIIDTVLIDHITNKQKKQKQNNKKTYIYNYDSIKDLIRCIRNTIQHHKEIQQIIQEYNINHYSNNNNNEAIILSLSSHESVIKYFESKLPDLLFFIYKKLKNHDDFKKLYFNF